MKILVACEESQAVCIAFRDKGHEAFSSDLLPCSGGHPQWHIQGDAIEVYESDHWDMVLAFPPCTDLSISGAKWFEWKKEQGRQLDAMRFFRYWTKIDCPRVAIENPVGIMSTYYRTPDQIIQPWQFGHGEMKATCLWLKGLPALHPTHIVSGREQRIWKMPRSNMRGILRSKTYPGIARAMADQWPCPNTGLQLELFNEKIFTS